MCNILPLIWRYFSVFRNSFQLSFVCFFHIFNIEFIWLLWRILRPKSLSSAWISSRMQTTIAEISRMAMWASYNIFCSCRKHTSAEKKRSFISRALNLLSSRKKYARSMNKKPEKMRSDRYTVSTFISAKEQIHLITKWFCIGSKRFFSSLSRCQLLNIEHCIFLDDEQIRLIGHNFAAIDLHVGSVICFWKFCESIESIKYLNFLAFVFMRLLWRGLSHNTRHQ